MSKRTNLLAAVAAFTLASAASAQINVPRLDGVTIDGSGADWTAKATRIDALMPAEGSPFSVQQLDARLQLAWDDRGLLLFATVKDPAPAEASVLADLWQSDCIELFLADRVNGTDFLQFLVAPGMAADFPEPRQFAQDQRTEALKAMPPELQLARQKIDGGYTMEILAPWSLLGREAHVDDTLALQFYVNSRDGGADSSRRKLVFYPKNETSQDHTAMHSLRLTQESTSHVRAVLNADYERFRRVIANLTGPADLAGTEATVTLRSRDLDVPASEVRVTFAASPDGRTAAKARLPLPAYEDPQITVTIDGEESEPVGVPSLAAAKARALLEQQVVFRPAVFSGEQFPKPDFINPDRAESLIGPYEIKCTYYNAKFEPVTTATEPGRYGAVVDIRAEDGRTLRRFITLYRTPKDINWWQANIPIRVQWPTGAGIDPIVAAEQGAAFDEPMKALLVDGAFGFGMGADLLAALHEIAPGTAPVDIMHDAEPRSRAWWVTLKRKLYGNDQRFTEAIDRPVVLESATAPVLRAGNDADAGFVPGTSEKLEALLKEWADTSREPFTVCLVRNGVVVIDTAYGTRDDKPMARETPSIVYSISKAVSGTAIMMAVDQGIVSLDDTPAKFLPPVADATGKQPTIRQLFTHTAGLWGHWGDEQNDFEQVIAEYLPNLNIGQKHEYNGASLALGCKILEQVSGESLPDYYQKHIFTPLEMKNTTSTSCSWRTWSTAADLAKLGQMLLNGGAYGNKRFMTNETYQQMLPHKLVKELSPETTQEWGIGLSWMNPEKTVYGHGSASSSTFRVDPAEKLVITMARNGAGDKFGEYNKRFLELIYASIQK